MYDVREPPISTFEKNQEGLGYVIRQLHAPFLSSEYREKSIMVKSKAKQEKKVETVEEFVERINKSAVRTNGLKKNLKGARR